MGDTRAVQMAWALCGLTTCLLVVLFGVNLLTASSKNVLQLASEALLSLAAPVAFSGVAALIVSRQPRNTIGWLLMVPVGLFLVGGPSEIYVQRLAPSSPAPTLLLLLMVWFNGWSWVLLIFPLLHIPLLFPNGEPPTPRWRWVHVAAIAWPTLFVLILTFTQPISSGTTPDIVFNNPIGVLREETAESLIGVWIIGLLGLTVLCVVALFIRYRHANETERKQIKWLLYACAVFLMVYVGGSVIGVSGSDSFGGYVWDVFFGLSLVAVPAAIGIAILRYRLFDIDIIIRRTLVYGVLTGLLALLYLGSVVLLQGAFRALTGQGTQLAVVVSTLVIAALFNPLRHRVQRFIDRRFYRKRYDAQQVLAVFGASLRERDNADLERLTGELLGVIQETMQPAHLSLWLREYNASGMAADVPRTDKL